MRLHLSLFITRSPSVFLKERRAQEIDYCDPSPHRSHTTAGGLHHPPPTTHPHRSSLRPRNVGPTRAWSVPESAEALGNSLLLFPFREIMEDFFVSSLTWLLYLLYHHKYISYYVKSINHKINRSIYQSVSQSINQSVSQCS